MPDFGLYITDQSFMNHDVGDSYFIGLQFADVKTFYNFEDNLFDFLILDHVVQQTMNLDVLFENSKRILKNNGKLIILVPDLFLSEKFFWPSKNKKNIYSFSLKYTSHIIKRSDHWHIDTNFAELSKKFDLVLESAELYDNNYDYNKSIMNSDDNNAFIKIRLIKKGVMI